jgi:glycosyltransferase involved in cell wall biosynthesis
VAVVVENVPLGVDTRLRKQVRDLSEAGYEVSVVTMRDPSNEAYRSLPGVRVLEYPAPPPAGGTLSYLREYMSAFCWAAVLTAKVRVRRRVDVLHLCQPPDIYFPLAWALKMAGARVVVDQRDLMPELLTQRLSSPPALVLQVMGFLERCTQRVADRTVCVNEYLRDRLIAAGASPDQICIVRNGPLLSRTEQARPDPNLRRGHRYLVCWAGKMGRQDRVDLVLDVADEIVNGLGRHDCAFVVLGDGECLEELRELTRARALDGSVFFPGWLTEAEVFAHMATADVGLDTSLQSEVSPVKALEYMALGLPLVSFDLAETRRICDGAAVFAPPGDTKALARALATLLSDPEERGRLADVGRRRMQNDLAWEHQRQGYLSAVGPRDLESEHAQLP